MRIAALLLLCSVAGACRGHWTPIARPSAAPLNAIRMLSNGSGWAVGNAGAVFATTDAGRTWIPQATPLTSNILSVDFATPMVGWITGENGDAARTTDGGDTWQGMAVVVDDLGLGMPDFVAPVVASDATHAWTMARWGDATFLYHTQDGGSTWKKMAYSSHAYTAPSTIHALSFSSDTAGWLLASRVDMQGTFMPVFLNTTDGGATWKTMDATVTRLTSPAHPRWQAALQAVSSGAAWGHVWDTARGVGEVFNLTSNPANGQWQNAAADSNSAVRSISFVSATSGYMVGSATMEFPGGSQPFRPSVNPNGVVLTATFGTLTGGWAAGQDGAIYRWSSDRYGDVNGDGRLDLVDAALALRIAAGAPADPVTRSMADLYPASTTAGIPPGDGRVDANDVKAILAIISGMRPG